MRKKFIYIIFLALLSVSCEEYYHPDLESGSKLLVVESRVTNDPNQNFVKLKWTKEFYSIDQEEKISGAKVELVEVAGQIIEAKETITGYYTFPKTPLSGQKYMLRITYNQDIFESDRVIMPPLPSIDTLYGQHKVEKIYMTDAYGGVMEIENSGREICIDAPINPSLEYYRFNWRAVLQWVYTPPSSFGSSPPPIYGWRSIFSGGLFNIAGPKQFSTSIKLKNHPIITLSYKPLYLLDSLSRIPHGWILMIDQYGTTKESYDFHERMNKQFSADGSLFDPILTQVYGNIHCKTDTKKIVLGFFDLNSYRHYRYFLNPGSNEYSKIVQRRINRRLNIPNEGTTVGNPPDFWEIYN